jgi:head-tail adaptor
MRETSTRRATNEAVERWDPIRKSIAKHMHASAKAISGRGAEMTKGDQRKELVEGTVVSSRPRLAAVEERRSECDIKGIGTAGT